MNDFFKELINQVAKDANIEVPPCLFGEEEKKMLEDNFIPAGKIITYQGEKWRILTHIRTMPVCYMIESLNREIEFVEIECKEKI